MPGAHRSRRRELAAEHLLLYSSSPDDSFVLKRILAPAQVAPARVSFIMLTEAMIEMARAGLGVAVLPRWSAQPVIATRSVVPLVHHTARDPALLDGGDAESARQPRHGWTTSSTDRRTGDAGADGRRRTA